MLFHEIPWFIQDGGGQSPVLQPSDMYLQLRLDDSSQDALLTDLIGAATEQLETDTRRALIQRNFTLIMDQFPYWGQLDRQSIERTSQAVGVFYGGGIFLRINPVVSVNSIQFLDPSGNLQTLASDGSAYITDLVSEPARIYPAYGIPWPITRWIAKAITISLTCGYGTTKAAVPFRAVAAIRMLVAHWFRHPEAVGTIGDEIALGYWSCVHNLRWSASPW